jgi:hypothetical protein
MHNVVITPRRCGKVYLFDLKGQQKGHMRRREVITLLGGAVAWPLAAHAQQSERMRRIGVLMLYAEGDPVGQGRAMAFRQTLEQRGWTVGRNLAIDYQWGVGDEEWIRSTVGRMMKLAPDDPGQWRLGDTAGAAGDAHDTHRFHRQR